MRKPLLVALPLAFVALVTAGVLAFVNVTVPLRTPPVQPTVTSHDTQVIDAVQREEQVVLLSLGIQGISERTAGTKVWGVEVPGTKRTSFLQYHFTAKLGLEGKDVRIARTGEHQYRLTLPPFVFIGHDDVGFKLAAEQNGALSWITPKIDTVETVNQILNDESKAQYVASNREALTEQAKSFYGGIIRGVDPIAEVTFDVTG